MHVCVCREEGGGREAAFVCVCEESEIVILCMYVFMYVCMYERTHVRRYVWIYHDV